MIKVVAIDDEPLALLQLQKMIEITPYFTLIAACSNAFEALKVMEQETVDAIFTDINMPDLSGLDLTRLLSGNPIIVFTTAYPQYAIEGYKVNAIDYLLKPFGQAEFMRAAMKVKRQYELTHPVTEEIQEEQENASESSQQASIQGDILFVKVDYRIVRISISEIRYIESQSEYLKIYLCNGQSLMVLMSIKRMAMLLPPDRFVRIHRSYIVNMSYVKEVARLKIYMDSDTVFPIGDSYKESVLKYINDRMIGKD